MIIPLSDKVVTAEVERDPNEEFGIFKITYREFGSTLRYEEYYAGLFAFIARWHARREMRKHNAEPRKPKMWIVRV